MELPAGADAKLGEHLAQVVLNGAGADEQAGTNLRARQTLSGQPRDLGLLGSQRFASRAGRRAGGLGRCAYGLSRRWSAARGGRARRTPPSPLRPASGMRCATGRAPWRYGARGAATRRKAGENGPARNEAGSGQGGTHNRRQRLNAAEPAGCPRKLAGSTVWLPVRLPMLLTEPIGIPTIWARYRLPRRNHELRQ